MGLKTRNLRIELCKETDVVIEGGCEVSRNGIENKDKYGTNKNVDAPTQPYQDAQENQFSSTALSDEMDINTVEPTLGKDELEALSDKFSDVKLE